MIDLGGETLGGYVIEAPIGSDAAGEFYRARHMQLGRSAVLMVLERSATSAAGFQEHFQNAMRRAAALHHPNIVEIYDFGVQNDHAYVAQEPADMGALSAQIQRSTSKRIQFPIALAVDFACQAADGLAYAHGQGVIHGAIAPSTLLLQRQGNGSASSRSFRLKIADFGIAELLPAAALSSPACLSPEQCQGGGPDARSDLYSLGAVLYELVTGVPPFAATTLEEAAPQHLHMLPPSPRQLRPDLPASLEAIILRCLAKSPDERFGTASELAAVLRQLQSSLSAPTAVGAGAGAAPAPAAALASATALQRELATSPYIQVLDAQGRTLQTVKLTKAGLTVGRAPENDVCIDDPAIARNQLLIAWHEPQVLTTDLGSSTATFLGSQRLPPFVQQPWDGRAMLNIGPYRLKLVSAAPEDPALQQRDAPLPIGAVAPPPGVGRIGVRLDPEQITLTPGDSTVVTVTLSNYGSTLDRLSVVVTGVSSAWVRGAQHTVQLSPGAEASIPLTIEVPRVPESLPGDYQVSVRARSATSPNESGTTDARWTVLPYNACEVQITPNQIRDHSVAEYQVTLRNEGNTQAGYLLSAADDDHLLKYSFAQDQALLKPGQFVTVPLTVRAPRRLFGSEQTREFTVQADIPSEHSESAKAQFIQRALMPVWLPLAVALLLLLAVLVNRVMPSLGGGASASAATAVPTALPTEAAAIVAPTALPTAAPTLTPEPGAPIVNLFTVGPQVVTSGQPVMVSWDVQGAERVTISQFGDVPPQGQREHRPEQTTDYRLVAVAGGKSTTRIERVNVVAPSAVVEPSVVPSPVPTEAPAPPEPTAALPTAVPAPPPPVNLLDLAPDAHWQANNRTIRFGQPASTPEQGGWADFANNVTLENSQTYPVALYTVPTTNTGGYIEGEFTIPEIKAGQFFLADIGFGPEARTPSVLITIKFSGEVILQGTKQPNGSLTPIRIDLTHLVGRTGRLTLRVEGSGGTAKDGIYWLQPRIDMPSQT